MEFTKEKPDCTFALPDKITVRQQLAYFSASSSVDQAQFLERSWEGAKAIIIPQSWKCAIMPDMNANLDDLTDPAVADVILWAGMRVREHMNGLEALPKN